MTITHGADELTPVPVPKTTDDRIADLEFEISQMREELTFIKDHIVKAATTIDKVAVEVMPTLDSLMKSPMLKMLLPKEKK